MRLVRYIFAFSTISGSTRRIQNVGLKMYFNLKMSINLAYIWQTMNCFCIVFVFVFLFFFFFCFEFFFSSFYRFFVFIYLCCFSVALWSYIESQCPSSGNLIILIFLLLFRFYGWKNKIRDKKKIQEKKYIDHKN